MKSADPQPQRDILAAELMAELAELRGIGMRLAREIGRQAEADPETAATPETVLRFQRLATTVARIGAMQLAVLDGQGLFAQEAEAARQASIERAQKRAAKAGAMLKKTCAYLFEHEVLQPAVASGRIDEHDARSMRRDLFDWLFDRRDDAACLTLTTGDIMIGLTRRLGIEPPPSVGPPEQWEAAVRERWAYYDAIRAAEGTLTPKAPPDGPVPAGGPPGSLHQNDP